MATIKVNPRTVREISYDTLPLPIQTRFAMHLYRTTQARWAASRKYCNPELAGKRKPAWSRSNVRFAILGGRNNETTREILRHLVLDFGRLVTAANTILTKSGN